mgnify:CR=1 FL=1
MAGATDFASFTTTTQTAARPARMRESKGRRVTPDPPCTPLELLLMHLAERGIFLVYTDHLTDEELYERACAILANHVTGHLSLGYKDHLVVPCLDLTRDQATFLAVYADDTMRASWRALWPEDELPPRRRPVAQRDVWLNQLRPQ